jgi:hypothetical protein
MHKNATKCNETLSKWCKNKHGASKIMDTLETYHRWRKSEPEKKTERKRRGWRHEGGGREAARVSRDPWLGILWRGKRWRRWWCSVTLAERFTPPACFVQEDD